MPQNEELENDDNDVEAHQFGSNDGERDQLSNDGERDQLSNDGEREQLSNDG